MFRLFSSALMGVLVSSAFAADPTPAAPKPASADNAGRHDADSEFDKSRPLIHPVSYDECVAKGVPVITRREIYQDGWIDLNKNGKKDPYEDPAVPIEERITDLIGHMNVNEKTMQLVTLYGYNRVTPDYLPSTAWFKEQQKDGIGNIDEHLNGFNYYDNPRMPGNQFALDPRKLVWALNETRRFFIEDTRLGIPCEFTNEGLRGAETAVSTGFPCPLAQASTWDRDLVREIAAVAGRENHVLGYDSLYAPLLDVIRDPRWGRCEEMYGESPWLVGEYGVAAVKAIQEQDVTSSPKHYAVYSAAAGARQGFSRTDPRCPPHEVETVHLWPWRRVMRDSKPDGIMCSYNDYDGTPVAASRHFLTDILRGEMGFDGYVVSDSEAVEYLFEKHHVASSPKDAVRQTILAGMNVRTTFRKTETYVNPLRELIKEGAVPMEVVDSRVRDVLRVKFRRGLFDKPYRSIEEAGKVAMAKEHMDLSLRASRGAVTLLKNEKNFLPLKADEFKTIAVCGPNADSVEYARQHYGPLTNDTITVKRALEEYGGGRFQVLHSRGCDFTDDRWPETEILPQDPTAKEQKEIDEAVANAKKADLAVVVVGDSPYGSKAKRTTCGENNSRTGLSLAGHQDRLVRAIAATGKPFVVVHFSGRPNALNWPAKVSKAIVHSYLPGPFGGQAAVEAIFGDLNPSGKTAASFVKTTGQLPLAIPAKPAANHESNRAVNGYLYPFGHGLSYTTFAYKNLRLEPSEIGPDGNTNVVFEITNTGRREGTEIPQLYFHQRVSPITVFDQQLRGFDRVTLKPGETKTVSIPIDAAEHLWMLDRDMKRVVEKGEFDIRIGASFTDIRLKGVLTVK
ncbi:MAG: glycoside hydrolase family 3 C-terminal domain-containing protein [Akkermansiaceae bacterium]|nr:glycoside hydrolase family 3 C-terminal domain-containing protein [Akkermansiaceae bacterium]